MDDTVDPNETAWLCGWADGYAGLPHSVTPVQDILAYSAGYTSGKIARKARQDKESLAKQPIH